MKGIGRDFWLAAVNGLGEGFAVIVQALVVALGPVVLTARSQKQGRFACRGVRSQVIPLLAGRAQYGS